MAAANNSGTAHLVERLIQVRHALGIDEPLPDCAGQIRFADALDSMGLVEFVALLADDCGVTAATIDGVVAGRFGTVADLAEVLERSGLKLGAVQAQKAVASVMPTREHACHVLAMSSVLPEMVQPAATVNRLLNRPDGWLEKHAGIQARRLWAGQDPLVAAASAARNCLEAVDLTVAKVEALYVTSAAPPLPVGLAATLHQRVNLRAEVPAFEVGNACTGFLTAIALARGRISGDGLALVIALEAPSYYLTVEPGPAGEAAALFGDAAAAALIAAGSNGREALQIGPVMFHTTGNESDLFRVDRDKMGRFALAMDGHRLASQAVHALSDAVHDLVTRHGLALSDLRGIVAHGGNGRLPGVLARHLGYPAEQVWSETARTGNLGSASLPVAWAAHTPTLAGPTAWVAVAPGISCTAALTFS